MDTNLTVAGRLFDSDQSTSEEAELTELEKDFLVITRRGVRFHFPKENLRWSDRVADIPRRITFADGRTFETSLNDQVDRLSSSRHFSRSIASWERSWRRTLTGLAVVVIVAFLFLKWGVPSTADATAHLIPGSLAKTLSQTALKTMDQTYFTPSEINGTELEDWNRFFLSLTEKQDGIQILIRGSGRIGMNAFALPDGTIIVTDELLKKAPTKDHVLAVLYHEVGHVRLNHSIRSLVKSTILDLFFAAIVDIKMLRPISRYFLDVAYSREDERGADAFAAEELRKNDLDPKLLAEMLKIMDEASTVELPAILSTHPSTKERIKVLQDSNLDQRPN